MLVKEITIKPTLLVDKQWGFRNLCFLHNGNEYILTLVEGSTSTTYATFTTTDDNGLVNVIFNTMGCHSYKSGTTTVYCGIRSGVKTAGKTASTYFSSNVNQDYSGKKGINIRFSRPIEIDEIYWELAGQKIETMSALKWEIYVNGELNVKDIISPPIAVGNPIIVLLNPVSYLNKNFIKKTNSSASFKEIDKIVFNYPADYLGIMGMDFIDDRDKIIKIVEGYGTPTTYNGRIEGTSTKINIIASSFYNDNSYVLNIFNKTYGCSHSSSIKQTNGWTSLGTGTLEINFSEPIKLSKLKISTNNNSNGQNCSVVFYNGNIEIKSEDFVGATFTDFEFIP